MIVERLRVINFRNLAEISLDVSPRINIFLGRNGQGKTNLLEGLGYLALGRSSRGSRDRELIRFQQDHCHLTVEGRDGHDSPFRLEAALTREGRKRIKIDGQPAGRQADLVGHLSVVQFDPGEVELAKGSPEHRRRFLDYTLSLSSSDYFHSLVDYRRVIAQKNRLLKARHGVREDELDVWDRELVTTGTPLLRARAAMLEGLSDLAREAYTELAPEGGRLGLEIRSTVVPKGFDPEAGDADAVLQEAFEEQLHVARPRERSFGHSLVGPHRDRLELSLRRRPLRRYGSQGEMRSASIALKLAQAEVLYERTLERPVVLLDDIFSELDRVRTEALQRRLHHEHQLFIATARVDDVLGMREWDDVTVWRVRDGALTPLTEISEAALDQERVEMERETQEDPDPGRSAGAREEG